MEYLTREEILAKQKNLAAVLENHAGKSLKDNFAFKVFDKAVKNNFGADHHSVKILDLGTAGGAFAKEGFGRGYKNIYGVDIDCYVKPENKTFLKEFKSADLSWDKLPWPDDFFDTAVGWCVLPHLENPFHSAREVHRVLKRGGVFVFTAPYLASKAGLAYFKKYKDFGSYKTTNNHVSLLPTGVVEKTILKYFELEGLEYHFRSKIFLGARGRLRKFAYGAAKLWGTSPQRFLAERWAYNLVYILKNK